MKVCSKCSAEKPLAAFSRDASRRDGFRCQCKICVAKSAASYNTENKEHVKARRARWRTANPDKEASYIRNRSAETRANSAATSRAWIAANPERMSELQHSWEAANKGKRAGYIAARRAARMQRTPLWADLQAIRAIYEARPTGNHVDHVYPLRGNLVSGLHVPDNLQYLTPEVNSRKGNRYQP